jgi:hypothetical protein
VDRDEEVRVDPSDRVATWQDACREEDHEDQNWEDHVVQEIGGGVAAHPALAHPVPCEVVDRPAPSCQDVDHCGVRTGTANLKRA